MTIRIDPPYRCKQQATLSLARDADAVFRLMCPVAEHEWVDGWETRTIITESGLVETDCLFVTPGAPADAIWVTADHDPAARRLRLYKIVPERTVSRIDIAVDLEATGCTAHIAYELTALGEGGRADIDAHDAETFSARMQSWQAAIERHLD